MQTCFQAFAEGFKGQKPLRLGSANMPAPNRAWTLMPLSGLYRFTGETQWQSGASLALGFIELMWDNAGPVTLPGRREEVPTPVTTCLANCRLTLNHGTYWPYLRCCRATLICGTVTWSGRAAIWSFSTGLGELQKRCVLDDTTPRVARVDASRARRQQVVEVFSPRCLSLR